jgi:hypothetical protein
MSYFKPEDLKKFGEISDLQPEMGKKFFDWYGEVFKEGALTVREKKFNCISCCTYGAMPILYGCIYNLMSF